MSRRERVVRGYATALLDEVGVDEPPVDPNWVAAEKGIEIEERSGFPHDIYGALWRVENRFGIIISDACPTSGFRNFSIAHELGHYHIDGHIDSLFRGGQQIAPSRGSHFRDQVDKHEREADWFASELLMPVRFAGGLVLEREPTVASIRELANGFGVSLTAASIRYANLTDRAVGVVLSLDGKIEWMTSSDRIRQHGWGRRYMKREFVPQSSAAHTLAEDVSRVRQAAEETAASYVCEWFEGAPEHLEFEEESIGLGRYGRILTLLWSRDLPDPDDLHEERQRSESSDRDWRDALRGFEMG